MFHFIDIILKFKFFFLFIYFARTQFTTIRSHVEINHDDAYVDRLRKFKSKLCIRSYVAWNGDPRATIENLNTLWSRAKNLLPLMHLCRRNWRNIWQVFILNDVAFATVALIHNLQNEIAEKNGDTIFFFYIHTQKTHSQFTIHSNNSSAINSKYQFFCETNFGLLHFCIIIFFCFAFFRFFRRIIFKCHIDYLTICRILIHYSEICCRGRWYTLDACECRLRQQQQQNAWLLGYWNQTDRNSRVILLYILANAILSVALRVTAVGTYRDMLTYTHAYTSRTISEHEQNACG